MADGNLEILVERLWVSKRYAIMQTREGWVAGDLSS